MPKLKPEEALSKIFGRLDVNEETQKKLLDGEIEFDEINKHFEDTFISRAEAPRDEAIIKAVDGNMFGKAESAIKSGTSIEFKKDDKFSDSVINHVTAQDDKIKKLESDLEKAQKEGGNEEVITDLKAQIQNKDAEITKFRELHENTTKEFDDFKSEQENLNNGRLLSDLKSQAEQKVNLVDNPDQFKLKGVNSMIQDKFDVSLNEDKNGIVIKHKDGTPVMNENKTKELTYSDIYEQQVKDAGLFKNNNGGGSPNPPQPPAFPQPGSNGQEQPGEGDPPKRKLPASAQKHAQKLHELSNAEPDLDA